MGIYCYDYGPWPHPQELSVVEKTDGKGKEEEGMREGRAGERRAEGVRGGVEKGRARGKKRGRKREGKNISRKMTCALKMKSSIPTLFS